MGMGFEYWEVGFGNNWAGKWDRTPPPPPLFRTLNEGFGKQIQLSWRCFENIFCNNNRKASTRDDKSNEASKSAIELRKVPLSATIRF